MTSEVVFVEEGGQPSVLKACRDPIYVAWLRHEHGVLQTLAGTSLPVPKVLAYHEVCAEGAVVEAWLHMTRLPGESLLGVLGRAGSAERRDLLRRLGLLLRMLHETAPPPNRSQAPAWIDRLLEAAGTKLGWCDGSPELLARLRATRPPLEAEVLIHGDLALDDVLVDEWGGLHLIDWSGGGRGDPRYDLALALATEPEVSLGEADQAAFFESYGRPAMDSATRQWFLDLYEFF